MWVWNSIILTLGCTKLSSDLQSNCSLLMSPQSGSQNELFKFVWNLTFIEWKCILPHQKQFKGYIWKYFLICQSFAHFIFVAVFSSSKVISEARNYAWGDEGKTGYVSNFKYVRKKDYKRETSCLCGKPH